MVGHRDSLIPLVRIDRIFNGNGKSVDPWDGIVVVVENNGASKALLLDAQLPQSLIAKATFHNSRDFAEFL